MSKLITSDEQLSTELRKLFESCPPQDLRRTVESLYFSHASEAKSLQTPGNFNKISANIYQLIDFLDRVSEEEKRNKIGLVKGLVEKIMEKRDRS